MIPEQIHYAKIIVSALDWGMGHLSRSVALLRLLRNQGNQLFFAGTSTQLQFIKQYVTELEPLALDGYNLQFGHKGHWAWDLLKQRSQFKQAIRNEHEQLKKWGAAINPDFIISDHRYGFHLQGAHNVFITHQLKLPIPSLAAPVQNWHVRQLESFQSVWVPDQNGSPLSGKLSSPIPHPDLHYIGWLSRFRAATSNQSEYDHLIVLSGPDPYALGLIDELSDKAFPLNGRIAIIHPIHLNPNSKFPNVDTYSSRNMSEVDQLMQQAKHLISRSGYSTLMDLKILGLKASLIPTPGQAEQVYLSRHLSEDKQFQFI